MYTKYDDFIYEFIKIVLSVTMYIFLFLYDIERYTYEFLYDIWIKNTTSTNSNEHEIAL